MPVRHSKDLERNPKGEDISCLACQSGIERIQRNCIEASENEIGQFNRIADVVEMVSTMPKCLKLNF